MQLILGVIITIVGIIMCRMTGTLQAIGMALIFGGVFNALLELLV